MLYIFIDKELNKIEYNDKALFVLYQLLTSNVNVNLLKKEIEQEKKTRNILGRYLLTTNSFDISYHAIDDLISVFKESESISFFPQILFNAINICKNIQNWGKILILFNGYNLIIKHDNECNEQEIKNIINQYNNKKYLFIAYDKITQKELYWFSDRTLSSIYSILLLSYCLDYDVLESIKNAKIDYELDADSFIIRVIDKEHIEIQNFTGEEPVKVRIDLFMDLLNKWDALPDPINFRRLVFSYDGEKYDFEIERAEQINGLSHAQEREMMYKKKN